MIVAAPERLLIVKPSSFGDIVHALPALDAVSRHWPHTHIDWLVKKEWAELLQGRRDLRDVLYLPKTLGEWRRLAPMLVERRYDVVLDLQGLFRSGVASWLTHAPTRIGFADAREGSGWFYTTRVACAPAAVHAVARNLDLLRQIGVSVEAPARFALHVPEESESWVRALWARERIEDSEVVVVIHPAARWETKRWPAERFAQLADRLRANFGVRIVIVAGTEQMSQVDQVLSHLRGAAVNLAGQTTLRELAALLKKAQLVISNDSGPMHLAAAMGTPVIGLFGPTDPRRVGPYGGPHVALRKQFGCPGCRRNACVRDQSCLTAIVVDEVLAAAEPFLKRRSALGEAAHARS